MLRKEKSRFCGKSLLLRLSAICVIFCGFASAFAQPANDNTVELRLLVIDGWENQTPLPGTQVELVGGQEKMSWTTDSQGRVVAHIPVEMLDYQTEFLLYHREKHLKARHSLQDIPPGRKPTDPIEQTWVLSEVKLVTGKVVDCRNNPVAGAKVCCTFNHPINPAVTDEQGNFELEVGNNSLLYL